MEATETAGNRAGQSQTKNGLRAVKVLVADHDQAFREGLIRLLRPQRRIEIIGEAGNAGAANELIDTRAPHIVLLDYDFCRQLAPQLEDSRAKMEAPVSIVTLPAPERTRIIDSFRMGARGIILRESQARIWWKGISAVLAGQYWLGNESLAVLIQAIREKPLQRVGNESARHFGLTPREIEIVKKIALGRTNKEVGEHYSIRERTVKHHLTNIFGKVGVSSRLELALFAREHQILANSNLTDPLTASERETRKERERKSGGVPTVTTTESFFD